ncbi:MAG TPA: DUF4159 domain-containing protein [Vicinamibacteria bacterium]|nr:DUF4159 domain-containing protein [Vicinamibacteria bacterium]
MRRPVPALLLAAVTAVSAAADGYDPPEVRYENRPYNGKFTFARVRFRPSDWGPGNYMWGLDLKWNHDYPRAESHFTRILSEITTVDTNVGGGNVLAIDDPELSKYPVAYLCEPGFLTLNDKEAASLRAYLLKGGFLIVDDFAGRQWEPFAAQVAKALPGSRFTELDNAHPIFDSFFRVEDPRAFPHPYFRTEPNYLGLFEDNDPAKRLMMVVNYNQDISEYWEWSDTGALPIHLANEAYKLGVNYVTYGMTH